MRRAVFAALLFFGSHSVAAEPDPNATTLLELTYKREWGSDNGGSSGSSSGRQALVETVVETTPKGTVLSYDSPRDEDGDTNSNFWYFPARVLERPDGSLELLDIETVQGRIERWREKYNFPPEACGVWSHGGGFPYKVDCDPQSILEQIEPFDLRIRGLAVGAVYAHPLGRETGTLIALPAPRVGYRVIVALDPDKARAEEVEQELILAQMLDTGLTVEQAQADAAKTVYEGTITIEFDLDEAGEVVRKTVRSEVMVQLPNEPLQTKTSIATVTRSDYDEAMAVRAAGDL